MGFGLDEFARGFVAALVELDQSSVEPRSPERLRSLHSVRGLVIERGERLRHAPGDGDWFRDLVRLGNGLSPGQTGAFERFETALRDLRLSSTEPPGLRSEAMVLTISKPFAVSTLEALEPRRRELVRTAADLFLRGGGAATARS